MRDQLRWLNDALAIKDINRAMRSYRVEGEEIKATDGNITAGCPWPYGGSFLVPGKELERISSRLTASEISIDTNKDGDVVLKAGKFKGTIRTLPLEQWDYPGVDAEAWGPLPPDLLALVHDLRPFISDNATQQWAMGVALDNGWAYATNNIALAGGKCKGIGKAKVILPVWAIDFILARTAELTEWQWTETYVAFRWSNGAWMRSKLIDGTFPEKGIELIQKSAKTKPTQVVTPAFREAFERISDLAEDVLMIYADRIESAFGEARVEEAAECEVPETTKIKGEAFSLWGAKFLVPVMAVATHWSPSTWPAPTPFKGEKISGFVVGRSK